MRLMCGDRYLRSSSCVVVRIDGGRWRVTWWIPHLGGLHANFGGRVFPCFGGGIGGFCVGAGRLRGIFQHYKGAPWGFPCEPLGAFFSLLWRGYWPFFCWRRSVGRNLLTLPARLLGRMWKLM